MKVFYHNDMDGKCAAHIVSLYDPYPYTTFVAMNYGQEFPQEIVESGERVYILDYSIEPEEMKTLLRRTQRVLWIDHHKTAIAKYSEFSWPSGNVQRGVDDIKGIRNIKAAGCEITYEWFHSMAKNHPEYIQLIGDRDTWTWQYGDRTKFFFAGLEAEDTHPKSPIWHDLMYEEGKVDELVEIGGHIQKYKDRTQQEYIKENGFWVTFHDLKCYAACGRFSSQPFEAVVPEADIWLTFRYMPGGFWMVSLYSTKVDVSAIAKQYEYHGKRGGGHTGAAGFECDYPPFLPNAKAYFLARITEQSTGPVTEEDIAKHLEALERR